MWSKTFGGLSALAAVASGASFMRHRQMNLDDFIESQRAISYQGVLNNIGPDGSQVPGTSAGLVVASPSKSNPDYFFTWSRDSALTMKMIVDEFLLGKDELQSYVEDYITAQAVLQTVTNPSGTFLPSGTGLGEPKYNVDGTRFNGNWGRPQRDGPPLRAITLIAYSHWLIENGQTDKARDIVWPVISNDLSYTGQYWNETGFDLWEEVEGSSFFTTQNQYRALVEGASLAETLEVECTGCDQAENVLCFMQQAYWNGEFFIANINLVSDQGRNGRDANTVLGPIAVFDVNAQCDDPSIQPCNSRGLSNFKSFVDHFRNGTLYPINEGLPEGSGIALGRYTEDVYYDGNPWYLINAGAAEYLYGAVAQWEKQGRLTVDETSLDFFAEIYPDAAVRTYGASNSTEFPLIVDAVWTYADTFVEVLRQHTPANGSLSEQFNKTSPFNPTSARDLTWSYAAFITMAERRAGEFPPSWVSTTTSQPDIPSTCSAGSTTGVYEPATAAGAPDVNVTCTSTVKFQVEGETYFGESIYVTGNTTDLGGWTLENAWPLSASSYPVWAAEIPLVPGERVSYGFVREQDCGQPPIWETLTTGNRTIVVPDCDPDADPGEVLLTTDDTWTGEEGTSGGC